MRKKVLFIDYILEKGHVNFNHIHIDALKQCGFDVHLILHQLIADNLPYDASQYVAIIPSILRKREGHPLLNRVIFLLTLLYIKVKVRFKDYDHVIISSFDEISLGLLPLCNYMQIICHRNAIGFENSIKRTFLKRLAKHNDFIVFNESMAEPFRQQGIANVHIISHGVMPACNSAPSSEHSHKDIQLFHPSVGSDEIFLRELLSSEDFQQFLVDEHIIFTLRSHLDITPSSDRIRIIREFLPQKEYKKLFLNSDIILIIYPSTFRFTVSAVSFECVTYKKKALIKNNMALSYCKGFFNYNPFFDNISQLKERLSYIIHHQEAQCSIATSDLTPNYTDILK